MTDHAGGLRVSGAGPMPSTLKNCRHRLGEAKRSPGYIMARAKSQ